MNCTYLIFLLYIKITNIMLNTCFLHIEHELILYFQFYLNF